MNSVIIPTYNRSKSLLKTLDSLIYQTVPTDQYEILIIDDGSIDDTESQVKNYKLKVEKPEIRYFKVKHGGHPEAKNFGIKEAKGEILFFTDDDCIVPKNWMEITIRGYEKYPDIAGAGGWYVPPENETRFFQKTGFIIDKLFNSFFGDKEKIIDKFPACVSLIPNASYRKSILEEVGSFDPFTSYIEDVEMKYRVRIINKKQILYVPTAVEHRCTHNFFRYARKLVYQGMAAQYCNYKYFDNKPPLNFDATFWRAPKKLFSAFSGVLATKEAKKTDLPAIFIYFALEVFLNACGGFYERRKR